MHSQLCRQQTQKSCLFGLWKAFGVYLASTMIESFAGQPQPNSSNVMCQAQLDKKTKKRLFTRFSHTLVISLFLSPQAEAEATSLSIVHSICFGPSKYLMAFVMSDSGFAVVECIFLCSRFSWTVSLIWNLVCSTSTARSITTSRNHVFIDFTGLGLHYKMVK